MQRLVFLFFLWAFFTGVIPTARGQADRNLADVDSLIASALYDQAKEAVTRSLPAANDVQRALLQNRSAEISILQGKLTQAETELLAIQTGRSPFIDGVTENNMGFLDLHKARFDLAGEHFQKALAHFQESGNAKSLEAARCLSNLSLMYWSTGKSAQAEAYGLMALQIRQSLTSENSEIVAASYNDLGLVYSANNTDKALEYYEMAEGVYRKLHGSDHPKIAIANTNIGFMYQRLKLYGDAINNFETAEAIWKKIYPDGHPNQALALFDLGLTYQQMGNAESAMGYYEKSLALYRKFYGDKHPDIANVYNQIGTLKISQNQYDAALASYQEALCANAPRFNNKDLTRNPSVKDYYSAKVLLYSLRLKAEAMESRHYGRTLKPQELDMALSCLHACDSLIDDIRYHSSDESDKLELGSSANEVYEGGVRIAAAMSEMSLKTGKYRKEAFYFAEKSKSAVLQAAIADSEAKSFAGIPANLLDEENAIKADIALCIQRLSQKPDAEAEKALREELFTANAKYVAFVKTLEKNYPDYFNLKFNQSAPSIAEIQKNLPPSSAMVSYFIADRGQRLYTFVVTPRSFKVYNSTLPPAFDRLVKGFNNSLYYTVPESYRESVNQLAPLLLRGWPAAKEVVVIPSGRLSTMPFEALARGKVQDNFSFASLPYLINNTAISYAFSAGLLLQKSNKKTPNNSPPAILLCAPVTFPEKDNLDDLPGTADEVDHIASLFPSRATVYKGKDASESSIKSGKLADYRYLHLATHGIVDENAPELSRIFLQSSEQEDGNLFSGEIFNLRLQADLTVLSACQTGLGKFSKGEGVIGLSRALIYAGSSNIIVSYWSVADASTARLMTEFYRQLAAQGQSGYSTALQMAKKKMIQEKSFSAPFFWAPFVLIGM